MEKYYYLIVGLLIGYSFTHIFIFRKYSKILEQFKERNIDLNLVIKLLREEVEKKQRRYYPKKKKYNGVKKNKK